MNIHKRRVQGCLLVILMLLIPAFASADEVILDPGQLRGDVTIGPFTVKSLYVSAYNAQYSSIVQPSGNSYAMTLYGNQTYSVSTQAFIRNKSTYAPYTYLYFKSRSITVPKAADVINKYTVNPGVIRFQLNIDGASYTSWYVYGYASAYPADGEQTYSRSYAESGSSPSGEWVMPLVPNRQVRIYAYVYVDGKAYRFFLDTPYREDINPGQEVVVPLELHHVAPQGTVRGTVSLGNLGGGFSRHTLYTDPGYQYTHGYENPFDYSIDQVLSGSTLRAYTYMDDHLSYLGWPYPEGDQGNSVVTFAEGETLTRDFIAEAGALVGKISLSGTLTNATPADLSMSFNGNPGTVTYGGYAHTSNFDSQGNYRLLLTPGPWQQSELTVSESVPNYSRSLNIYDYSWPVVEIVAGDETIGDRDYCTGSLTVGFRVANGGVITNPYIQGNMSKQNADGARLSTNSYSTHYTAGENPSVEINGIEGSHQFNCFGKLSDGSTPKFGTLSVTLECGVKKGQELGSPTIVITTPSGQVITSELSIQVGGTATDETGIAGITINGGTVAHASGSNTEDAKEVAFTEEITLSPGANTLRTEARDTSGLVSFDERTILVDPWQPTVSWMLPEGPYFEGTLVPVEVTGTDQGYGAILQVYLDGTLLGEQEITGNDSAEESVTFTDALASIGIGPHTLTVNVTDKAGNTVTSTKTFEVVSNNRIAGNGYFYPETRAYRANINLAVDGTDNPSGFLRYYYTRNRLSFTSATISRVSLSERMATITGTGNVNGVGGYAFTATVTDGVPDVFGLIIKRNNDTVYHTVGPTSLTGGDLIITP